MKWIEKILDPDNLRNAWEEVRAKRGAAGVDHISIVRWERNWEERLVELARDVHTNTYKARKLRQFTISKRDGTPRTISILTVTDRVLQRAVLRVVDDGFDQMFLDCSYGYRPGRGVRDAVPAIHLSVELACQVVRNQATSRLRTQTQVARREHNDR